MIRFLISSILFVATGAAKAQKPDDLAMQTIPAGLQMHAHAVVRYEDVTLEIESPERMTERHSKIVSILDQQGLKQARFFVPYDRFSTVDDLRMEIYDAVGKSIKTYKQKDFKDRPFYLDDVEMAMEYRYLSLDMIPLAPPFTLEFKWTIVRRGILDYPNITPQDDYFIAVENARYEVQLPKNMALRYKCLRSSEPQLEHGTRTTSYVWHFHNLAAVPDEPFNLPIDAQTPAVQLSPSQFALQGYAGSFDSWDALANWNQQLLDALPPLDPKTAAEIREMTDPLPQRERIRAIYRFVQNSTRYISIQLGIGGWQPFDPNFVHTKRYGDCKALSWYTRALLKAAGIDAWYTLIYRGNAPAILDPAFPDHVFNHVVLAVPTSKGDTIWLECTSQTDPFGYVGPDISNRKALMIREGKGFIVQMPMFGNSENIMLDSVWVDATEDLKTARVHWNAYYTSPALNYYDGFLDACQADAQKQKKWIEDAFTLKGRQLVTYALHLDTMFDAPPKGRAEIHATSTQLFNLTAKRFLLQPNFFRPWTYSPLTDNSARVSQVSRRSSYTHIADFSMAIPAGWALESSPSPLDESTPFGTYKRVLQFENGQLHFRRSIALNAGVFPADQYTELIRFFQNLKKWDEERVVFTRK